MCRLLPLTLPGKKKMLAQGKYFTLRLFLKFIAQSSEYALP